MSGEIAVVGPPLSCLDADLAFQASGPAASRDARQAAQMNAAAQEARGLLGMRPTLALDFTIWATRARLCCF